MSLITEVRDKGIPSFPYGSSEYVEFWTREKNRIRNGVMVGNWHCPGGLYLMVNYLNIEASDNKRRGRIIRKPDFRDIDIEFFEAFNKAENDPEGKKGICLPAARELGKSIWAMSCLIRQTHFFPGTQSMISSFLDEDVETAYSKYLIMKSGLPPEFFISQLRDEGGTVYYGTKDLKTKMDNIYSILWRRSFPNQKTVERAAGPRPQVHIIDEAGKKPYLKEIIAKSEPMWRMGEVQTCVPLILGTGGSMDGGTRGFKEVFENPDAFNMVSFEPYSKEYSKRTCMFIPAWKNVYEAKKEIPLYAHFNLPKPKNENDALNTKVFATIDEDKAKEILRKRRDDKKKLEDLRSYYNECMYYPEVPSEVFMVSSAGIFDPEKLTAQLERMRLAAYVAPKFDLEVIERDGRQIVEPVPNDRGNFIIYEHPSEIAKPFQYVIGLDPVAQDASGTTSAAAAFVYKRFIDDPIGEMSNMIVAEYVKKGVTQDEYNEQLMILAKYYRCDKGQVLYENNVGNLVDYCKYHGLLNYLMLQPENVIKEIVPESKVQRMYGIHMTTEIKDRLIQNVRQYVRDNSDKIYSVSLIEELLSYVDEPDKNFDLVMAFGITLFAAAHFRLPKKKNIAPPGYYTRSVMQMDKNGNISWKKV